MDLREFWVAFKDGVKELAPMIIGISIGLLAWIIINHQAEI